MYASKRGHGPRHEDNNEENMLQPASPNRLPIDADKDARYHSMNETKPASTQTHHYENHQHHHGSQSNHHHSCTSGTALASQQVSRNDSTPRRESTGSNEKGMAPPPGTPEGGVWGSVKYEGACTGCIKLFVCLLSGALLYKALIKPFIPFCPCDKKGAYMVERDVRRVSDNKVYKSRTFYDTDGEMIAMKLYDVDTNEKVESHGNAKKFKPFHDENSTSTTRSSDLADDGVQVVTRLSAQGPAKSEAEATA